MSIQKLFVVFAILLFGAIGVAGILKKKAPGTPVAEVQTASLWQQKPKAFDGQAIEIDLATLTAPKQLNSVPVAEKPIEKQKATLASPIADVDRIELLFQKESPLPIVKTLQYKSRVSWKHNAPAWLSDWASHYNTTLDFVVRSLNGKPDYSVPAIREGDALNVLNPEKEFSFHLVVDLSRCKMLFYYVDPEAQEHFLIKTYPLGLGKADESRVSKSRTPLGIYKLGKRVAVFRPNMMGLYHSKRVELITVFGTRWIPFEKEVGPCTEPAKGFGIHGTPWVREENGSLHDDDTSIGTWSSEGCIRMRTQDAEELYSIISTRDTLVEIVRDAGEAKVPYKEKSL
jgi:hypothetical protein